MLARPHHAHPYPVRKSPRIRKAPAVDRPGRERNQVELALRWGVWMAFALTAAAAHGGFVTLGLAAAFAFGATLAVCAAAAFLAFLHRRFHVFTIAAGLAVFHFALVFAATGRGILGIGCGVVAATTFVVFSGHVVMTAPLGLRGRRRVRCSRRFLRPANQRQGKDEDQSKQSEFHKISLLKL